MIIRHYEDVEAVEMMKGVKKRVVIGDREGAPNFIMRIIELEPGASSPLQGRQKRVMYIDYPAMIPAYNLTA